MGVWDVWGEKHSEATRAKSPKTLREASASPGGEEGSEGPDPTNSLQCQKGLMCNQ